MVISTLSRSWKIEISDLKKHTYTKTFWKYFKKIVKKKNLNQLLKRHAYKEYDNHIQIEWFVFS